MESRADTNHVSGTDSDGGIKTREAESVGGLRRFAMNSVALVGNAIVDVGAA